MTVSEVLKCEVWKPERLRLLEQDLRSIGIGRAGCQRITRERADGKPENARRK